MAYFVDNAQCFAVSCFSSELCAIVDRPFKNKNVEISKLVRRSAKKKLKKSKLHLIIFVIFYFAAIFLVSSTEGRCVPMTVTKQNNHM